MQNVTGRVTDHFLKKDETIVHGEYFTHLFYLKDWVCRFHIIQEDFTKIRILVVPQGGINDADKNDIENKINLVTGEDTEIIWDFVNEIPKTRTGKYLYTKSLVKR